MAIGLDTGAQILAIQEAAAAENAINLATLKAKIDTMGLKAAKDIVQ
jgi:predicted aspartyl protease